MSFIPRATFQYPLLTPSWFAGHMAKSLREMGTLLQDIDLVIEARDARLPLTSINRAFDAVLEKSWGRRMDLDVLGGDGESSTSGRRGNGPNMGYNVGGKGKERLVVYTKKDLAEERYEKPLIRAFRDHSGQKVLFSDTTSDSDVKEILRHAVKFAKSQQDYMTEMRILVVGMPNVGKSSLLNALRRVGVHKAKHFKTGAMAGVTKKLTGTVKIHQEPTIYVYDTPGVMVPFLGHGADGAEKGLKYALTAGIKEDLFELEVVVDYLLWRMNQRIGQVSNDYLQTLPLRGALTEPTDDLYTLLDPLCDRIGALKRGGERDYEAGLMFIIRAFREGKLGRWTFDNLEPKGVLDANANLNSRVSLAVKEYLHGMPGEDGDEAVQSKSQVKKAELKARQEKRLAKWKLKYPALAAAKAARRR